MGAYLDKPATEKVTEEAESEHFSYGVSAMQGWRLHMEDAHKIQLSLDDKGAGLFAIFDGHGGKAVAKFASRYIVSVLQGLPEYKEGRMADALAACYLKLDELLLDRQYEAELKELAGPPSSAQAPGDVDQDVLEKAILNVLQEHLQNGSPDRAEGSPSEAAYKLLDTNSLAAKLLNVDPGDEDSEEDPDYSPRAEAAGDMEIDEPESLGESSRSTSIGHGMNQPRADQPATVSRAVQAVASEIAQHAQHADQEGDLTKPGTPPTSRKRKMEAGLKLALKLASGDSGTDATAALGQSPKTTNITAIRHSDPQPVPPGAGQSPGGLHSAFQDAPAAGASPTAASASPEGSGAADGGDTPAPAPYRGPFSGCTAVTAVVVENRLYVANAGDSRCVLSRGGRAVALSLDHKPKDAPELDRITRAGGYVDDDGRINGCLNLSRALGDFEYKRSSDLSAQHQMVTAWPDVREMTLQMGDEFLLLACDGIWDILSNQEAVDFVREGLARGESPAAITRAMCDRCLAPNTRGRGEGCDNMSALVVTLKPFSPFGHKAGASVDLGGLGAPSKGLPDEVSLVVEQHLDALQA